MIEKRTEIHTGHDFPAIVFRDDGSVNLTDLILSIEEDVREKEEEKRAIICRSCRNVITYPDRIVNIEGQHSHVFTNPAGISFKIGCFSEAPGCFNTGALTDEYTWFSGFSWCFAICAGCFNHLGWFYTKGDSFFYGLILDSIAENR